MTQEQTKPKDDAPAPDAKAAAPKGKSPLVKYIIFGVIGVVAVGAVAVGTVFLLGNATHKVGDAANGSDSTTITHDSSASHAEMTPEDSLQKIADSLAGSMEDTSLLANVKKNLAFLDGASADSAMKADSVKAAQDSIIAMGWIGKEKERLTQKENDLNIREVKLNKLDQEIARKLLKIEQVTTSKITDLAKLYDGIEPKAVAAMMANLDNETIVAVLPRMKQKIAAQVLGMLPPARAAQISKQMIEIAEN